MTINTDLPTAFTVATPTGYVTVGLTDQTTKIIADLQDLWVTADTQSMTEAITLAITAAQRIDPTSVSVK